MDRDDLDHIVSRHRGELERLGARLADLRSGRWQVAAAGEDGQVHDQTPVHIDELERLRLWLTENLARYEALLGA